MSQVSTKKYEDGLTLWQVGDIIGANDLNKLEQRAAYNVIAQPTEPQDDTSSVPPVYKRQSNQLWINTSEVQESSVPEIKDADVTPEDTWSSQQLNSDIKKIINLLGDGKYTITQNDLEQGSWSFSTKNNTYTDRIRNINLIPVSKGMQVIYTNPTMDFYCGVLSQRDSQVYNQPSGWIAPSNETRTININATGYLVLIFRRMNILTVPSDYDSSVTIINSKTENTLQRKGTLPNNTDLNEITTEGVYILSTENTYINSPARTTLSHFFIVYKAYNLGCCQQIIPYNASLADGYFRIQNYNGEAWNDWYKMGKFGKTSLPNNTDLNTLRTEGSYLLTTQTNKYLNLPSEIKNTTAHLIVHAPSANGFNYTIQFLRPYNSYKIFIRNYVYSSDSWTEWETDCTNIQGSNPEFLSATIDSQGRLIEGITQDKKEIFIPVKIHNLEYDNNNEQLTEHVEYNYILQDSQNNLIETIDNEKKMFHIPVAFKKIKWEQENLTDLMQELKNNNISMSNQMDWSDSEELSIPEPKCATINIIADTWPRTKTADINAWVCFWDMQGNYFKKPCILNAQGNSTLAHMKKNATIDLYNGDWNGDEFSLRIGDWVPQDSFHLKAYYLDFFKGTSVISYKMMDEVEKTHGIMDDRPWKKELIKDVTIGADNFGGLADIDLSLDTGAKNFPDGFPCKIFLNGEFYGLYAWQLKKHRDNYHMKKNEAKHIHLDGIVRADTILGTGKDKIEWEKNYWGGETFEIRNPKDSGLVCINSDGTLAGTYDADNNRKELIDENSSYYDAQNKDHVRSAKVKKALETLSEVLPHVQELYNIYIANPTSENLNEFKNYFEKYFDLDNLIDYQIVTDVIYNTDGLTHNWQWTTYDGVKWYINIYDADMAFGGFSLTSGAMSRPLQADPNGNYKKNHLGLGKQLVNRREAESIDSDNAITIYLPSFYLFEINDYAEKAYNRYKELRDMKIIDINHITEMMKDWTERFGYSAYEQEAKTWKDKDLDNYPFGDSTVHSAWKILLDEDPSNFTTYSSTKTYNAGDKCRLRRGSAQKFYVFEAQTTVQGIEPISKWRYNDSIYRLYLWITESITQLDKIYYYSNN